MNNNIKYDSRNYRIHPENNKRLIEKSLTENGTGRSIVIDKNDEIVCGNGVYEATEKLGLPVRIIESDGTELIAIKRTDLSTEDARRKALALADNHTSDTSMFDVEVILEDFSPEDLEAWEVDIHADVNLDDFFNEGTGINDKDKKPKTVICPHCGKEHEV